MPVTMAFFDFSRYRKIFQNVWAFHQQRSCYDFSDFAILCVSWKCQPQMQPGRCFFHFLSNKWTKITKIIHILPHSAWQVSFPTQLSWVWHEDGSAHQHRPPQPTIPPHPPKLNFHLKEPQINLKGYLNNIKNNNNNKNNINKNSTYNNNNNNQTKNTHNWVMTSS